ncbi:fungal hydrophobin-domain-containing protein [Scleroderma citrinum]
MFTCASTLFIVAIAAIVTAAPNRLARGGGGSNCNTGSLNCCNTVQSTNNPQTSQVFGLLGIPVDSLNGNIGFNCVPITPIGIGQGASCEQNPVCCQGNQAGGLIGINCAPISLNVISATNGEKQALVEEEQLSFSESLVCLQETKKRREINVCTLQNENCAGFSQSSDSHRNKLLVVITSLPTHPIHLEPLPTRSPRHGTPRSPKQHAETAAKYLPHAEPTDHTQEHTYSNIQYSRSDSCHTAATSRIQEQTTQNITSREMAEIGVLEPKPQIETQADGDGSEGSSGDLKDETEDYRHKR